MQNLIAAPLASLRAAWRHSLLPAFLLIAFILQSAALAQNQPGCANLEACKAACSSGNDKACKRAKRLTKLREAEFNCKQGVAKACQKLGSLNKANTGANACLGGDKNACAEKKKIAGKRGASLHAGSKSPSW